MGTPLHTIHNAFPCFDGCVLRTLGPTGHLCPPPHPLLCLHKGLCDQEAVSLAGDKGKIVYLAMLFCVAVLFADAVRSSMHQKDESQTESGTSKTNSQILYFRSQRNMYLHAGLLFVSMVNKGLVSLNFKLKTARDEVKALRKSSSSSAKPVDSKKTQ